ncbi:MAG: ABC transporter permease, partial [Acidobacteriaceae bacterium]
MTLRSWLRSAVRNLLHKQQVEHRLDAEVRAYAGLLTDERIAAGMSPEEARRTALRDCGGIEQVKQSVRDHRAGAALEAFSQDLRYALRQLRRSPAFAALAILTLAIGIGANTAIFSFVNSVLLRPMPYPSADRLTILYSGLGYSNRAPFSSFELYHFRQRTKQFDQVAGIWVTNGPLPGEGDAEQVKVADTTSNFLPLLIPRPALGRFFGPEDDLPDAPNVIILSHAVWVRRFGSDPAIIGKLVRFRRNKATVVGV